MRSGSPTSIFDSGRQATSNSVSRPPDIEVATPRAGHEEAALIGLGEHILEPRQAPFFALSRGPDPSARADSQGASQAAQESRSARRSQRKRPPSSKPSKQIGAPTQRLDYKAIPAREGKKEIARQPNEKQ